MLRIEFFAGSFADDGVLDTHVIVWDFGDGITATGSLTPAHVYADDGMYTVTLTITDDDGGAGMDHAVVAVSATITRCWLPLVMRNYSVAGSTSGFDGLVVQRMPRRFY